MASHSDDLTNNPVPPDYVTHAGSSEQLDTSDHQSENQDRKAAYALTLQKTCNIALQSVKNNNLVVNSNWASPLAAVPSAISTMAILLKIAKMRAAAGLEIESQQVKDETGTVSGTLPSKLFHTNLQHCSDVGRLAFLEAQHGMNNIRETVQGMIAEDGTHTEDARSNLKSEITAIKASAKKCLEDAKVITSKFEYWHLVICHLRLTSLSKRGETINLRGEALARAKEQREYQWKIAAGRVNDARENERKVTEELAGIVEILDESTRQFGKLKEQIEPLVDFFKTILSDIKYNVEENLEALLRPITHSVTESSDPEQVQTIRISRRSKERILANGLRMQGRLSAMADISTAYIKISTDYIRPTINRMEGLSIVSESEWNIRSVEFFQWCETSMTNIDEIARSTNTNVQRNAEFHINALQRIAIESAASHDENA